MSNKYCFKAIPYFYNVSYNSVIKRLICMWLFAGKNELCVCKCGTAQIYESYHSLATPMQLQQNWK
jgi:hypothetical protein